MKNTYFFRKGLVGGIVTILIAAGFLPIITANVIEQNNKENAEQSHWISGSFSDKYELNEGEFIDMEIKNDPLSPKNGGFGESEPMRIDNVEVLAVHYDEDLWILKDGGAEITLSLSVPPSKLSDMYRDMFGVPTDVAIEEILKIPEEVVID